MSSETLFPNSLSPYIEYWSLSPRHLSFSSPFKLINSPNFVFETPSKQFEDEVQDVQDVQDVQEVQEVLEVQEVSEQDVQEVSEQEVQEQEDNIIRCKKDFTLLSVDYKKGDAAPLFLFRDKWYGRVINVCGNKVRVYKPSEIDCQRICNRDKGTHFLVKAWLKHEFYHTCAKSCIKHDEKYIIEQNKNNTGSHKKRKHECDYKQFKKSKRSMK